MSSSRCGRCGASLAGNGEASGLIDVRALATMLNAAPRTAPQAPRMNDLVAAPVVLAPAPAPVQAARVAPTQTPLYYMLGVLALGMLGLGTLIVAQPAQSAEPQVRVIETPVAVAAPAKVAAEPEEAAEPEPERVAKVEVEAPVEAPKAELPAAKGARKSEKKLPAGAPVVSETKPPVPVVASNEPAPDSVSCLIEPETCKKAKPAPVVETPPPAPSTSLPEKLEPADISEGTRDAKAAALSKCRSLARGGEKVTIKLSIAGPEGAVLSAAAQDDAGNPQLAACCAGELSKSSFKKVQKAQIGAVATLKF